MDTNQVIWRIKKDPLKIKKLSFDINLEEVPDEVAQCENLKSLSVEYSEVKVLPEFLTNLEHLQKLDFSGCEYLEFPKNLKEYPTLKELGVFVRTQDDLQSVFELENLQSLKITGDIQSIPEQIVKLKHLKSLEICGVRLKTLPKNLYELENLQSVSIECGSFYLEEAMVEFDFEQMVEVLSSCKKLTTLSIRDFKKLENFTLPSNLAKLKNLKKLYLERNKLKNLPQGMWELENIEILSLHYNKLDLFPKDLYKLSKLKELDFGANKLTCIPNGISKLTELKVLKLNANHNLDIANISDEIKSLSKLKTLDVKYTQSE